MLTIRLLFAARWACALAGVFGVALTCDLVGSGAGLHLSGSVLALSIAALILAITLDRRELGR